MPISPFTCFPFSKHGAHSQLRGGRWCESTSDPATGIELRQVVQPYKSGIEPETLAPQFARTYLHSSGVK